MFRKPILCLLLAALCVTGSLGMAAASEVACPLIAECPMSLECRVTDVIPQGTHDLFLADVVAVHVDESLLDEKGKLHVERANLVAFAHGEYFELGRCVGTVSREKVKFKNFNVNVYNL